MLVSCCIRFLIGKWSMKGVRPLLPHVQGRLLKKQKYQLCFSQEASMLMEKEHIIVCMALITCVFQTPSLLIYKLIFYFATNYSVFLSTSLLNVSSFLKHV